MPGPTLRAALLLCLAGWTFVAQADAPSTPVVRTQAQLMAAVASSRPTPLDALTPYGKRELLRSIRWGEKGITGFSHKSIVRELDAQQLLALMAFLDTGDYFRYFKDDLTGSPLRLPEPSPDLEQRLIAFEQASSDAADRRRATTSGATELDAEPQLREYTRLFGDRMTESALRSQALGDLQPLFDAANHMNFDYPGSALQDMLRVHRELEARGVDSRRSMDDSVLNAMITSRQFDQARSFAGATPHLGRRAIPVVADPLGSGFSGRSLYRYDRGSNTLTREAAPAPAGIQVVMVVNAGCQFSANALAAVSSDAGLQARLRQANLLIVTPPASSIPFHFLSQWNAANPALPVRVPVSLQEWQAIDARGVPAFFVLKDGKLAGQLSGWPEEGNKAALLTMLDAAQARVAGP